MKSNQRKIILLIILLVTAYFFISYQQPKKEITVTAHFYDANMNPISIMPLSLVNGQEKTYVSFTIAITSLDPKNTLHFNILSVTPSSITPYLPNNTLVLPPNTSSQFSTGLIPLKQFENSILTATFNVSNEFVSKLASSEALNIQPSPTPKVLFRTSSLTYYSGAALAFNSQCGGAALGQYGYYGATSATLSGTCAANMGGGIDCGTSQTLLASVVPGGWKVGGADPSLWKSDTIANLICVCDDSGTQYQVYKYKLNTGNYASVSSSSDSVTPANEVNCP